VRFHRTLPCLIPGTMTKSLSKTLERTISTGMLDMPKSSSAVRKLLKIGLQYIWVDTCCIDKSSSAELLEAINSMFKWYQDAKVYYAYLADISKTVEGGFSKTAFVRSRWFTRGWTLQIKLGKKILS
jgi:hypothetical protein